MFIFNVSLLFTSGFISLCGTFWNVSTRTWCFLSSLFVCLFPCWESNTGRSAQHVFVLLSLHCDNTERTVTRRALTAILPLGLAEVCTSKDFDWTLVQYQILFFITPASCRHLDREKRAGSVTFTQIYPAAPGTLFCKGSCANWQGHNKRNTIYHFSKWNIKSFTKLTFIALFIMKLIPLPSIDDNTEIILLRRKHCI